MQDDGESQSAFLAGAEGADPAHQAAARIATAFPEAHAGARQTHPVGGEAPMVHESADNAPVAIAEAPLRGMISLKTDLAHPDVHTAMMNAVGLKAPSQRKALFDGERSVLWMAPDELLIMTPLAEVASRIALIDQTLAANPRLIVDVSDARAIFRLTGAGAREVLAKGAPIDLHPESFRIGDLRRTRFSTVAAAIYQVAAAPETFEMICFRSYAPAMWRWLAASSAPESLPMVFGRG